MSSPISSTTPPSLTNPDLNTPPLESIPAAQQAIANSIPTGGEERKESYVSLPPRTTPRIRRRDLQVLSTTTTPSPSSSSSTELSIENHMGGLSQKDKNFLAGLNKHFSDIVTTVVSALMLTDSQLENDLKAELTTKHVDFLTSEGQLQEHKNKESSLHHFRRAKPFSDVQKERLSKGIWDVLTRFNLDKQALGNSSIMITLIQLNPELLLLKKSEDSSIRIPVTLDKILLEDKIFWETALKNNPEAMVSLPNDDSFTSLVIDALQDEKIKDGAFRFIPKHYLKEIKVIELILKAGVERLQEKQKLASKGKPGTTSQAPKSKGKNPLDAFRVEDKLKSVDEIAAILAKQGHRDDKIRQRDTLELQSSEEKKEE